MQINTTTNEKSANCSAIPLPCSVPNILPKNGASIPPGSIAGSNKSSASGPEINSSSGDTIPSRNELAANTRPCIFGGTFES
ncbi:hypothetical protein ABN584_26085 [Gloeocapsa sp. BRSZ]